MKKRQVQVDPRGIYRYQGMSEYHRTGNEYYHRISGSMVQRWQQLNLSYSSGNVIHRIQVGGYSHSCFASADSQGIMTISFLDARCLAFLLSFQLFQRRLISFSCSTDSTFKWLLSFVVHLPRDFDLHQLDFVRQLHGCYFRNITRRSSSLTSLPGFDTYVAQRFISKIV